ncbi:MAG: hypothetical protein ACKVS7_01350 [Gemmatimonadaceae bacterium]
MTAHDGKNDHDALDPRDAARLREALAALPREIEPEHDLWPEIHAQLDLTRARGTGTEPTRTAVTPISSARRPWRSARWLAAAAALVLFTATSTWALLRQRATLSDEAATVALLADFERSASELQASLDRRQSSLDPRTRAILERSLRTIDGAIAEARVALAERPQDPAIQAFVASAFRQKLDFLRRANDVAAEMGL